MEVIVVPAAEAQIRQIDDWWREHRTAAPGLFSEELAAAIPCSSLRRGSGAVAEAAAFPACGG